MSGLEASLLLGSAHGVLLAVVLGRRARNRRANRYLAALLGAMSLLLLDGFLRARGLLQEHPHLIGLTAWVPFVLGPLVYLYVREMTAPDPSRYHAPWRHFVVTAAYVVLLVVTFFPRSASYKLAVAQHDKSLLIQVIEVGLLGYGIVYASAAILRLHRHRGFIQDLFSNLHGVSLRWLFVLAILNLLVWIAALVAFFVRVTGVTEAAAASAIVPLGSTLTVFVIGYFQLGQAEIYAGQPAVVGVPAPRPRASELPAPSLADTHALDVQPPVPEDAAPARELVSAPTPAPGSSGPAASPTEPPPIDEPGPAASAPEPEPTPPPVTEGRAAPAYQRARLPEEDASAVEARIKAAMTERQLYKRPGLTLGELADEVAATPHEVSQVLSTRLGRNFYNFVNEHRIEHVKQGLRTSDRSVLDLAFEAGFQSKSTFNSAFRKATGTTPREFRQRATA